MEKIQIFDINGRKTATLVEECGFDLFYKLVSYVEKKLDINFVSKVDDFDSLFYTFINGEEEFLLYYNIYDGIRLQLINCSRACEEVFRVMLSKLIAGATAPCRLNSMLISFLFSHSHP